jgi:hypothetical protein
MASRFADGMIKAKDRLSTQQLARDALGIGAQQRRGEGRRIFGRVEHLRQRVFVRGVIVRVRGSRCDQVQVVSGVMGRARQKQRVIDRLQRNDFLTRRDGGQRGERQILHHPFNPVSLMPSKK